MKILLFSLFLIFSSCITKDGSIGSLDLGEVSETSIQKFNKKDQDIYKVKSKYFYKKLECKKNEFNKKCQKLNLGNLLYHKTENSGYGFIYFDRVFCQKGTYNMRSSCL